VNGKLREEKYRALLTGTKRNRLATRTRHRGVRPRGILRDRRSTLRGSASILFTRCGKGPGKRRFAKMWGERSRPPEEIGGRRISRRGIWGRGLMSSGFGGGKQFSSLGHLTCFRLEAKMLAEKKELLTFSSNQSWGKRRESKSIACPGHQPTAPEQVINRGGHQKKKQESSQSRPSKSKIAHVCARFTLEGGKDKD